MKVEPILETDGLTKRFGGLTAVDHLNIGFNRGEIKAVIGPNGAGKTTFFNLLSGLVKPTSGEIIYQGKSITDLSPQDRSQKGIARSFQLTQIFPALPVLENVRISVQSRASSQVNYNMFSRAEKYEDFTRKAQSLLERVGLEEEYFTQASNLNRADQRKLDLTIAIANAPKVLLLDEPTAGIAIEEIPEILGVIEGLKKDQPALSIVLIEHNIDIVMNISDTICVLVDGRKLAEGAPEIIGEDEEVKQAYLRGLS